MPRTVFISYSWKQGDWVWDRLVPCLRAGGATVVIDRERFQAGKGVPGQMDAAQDGADVTVLVLSPDYLDSPPCQHEMKRAVERDPNFERGAVVPVMRVACDLPAEIKGPNPLYADLRDDRQARTWDLLMAACGSDLNSEVPGWLATRDEIRAGLGRNESVNLVVNQNPKWLALIDHLRDETLPDLEVIDLEHPETITRSGLVARMMRACGSPAPPPKKNELVALTNCLGARKVPARLALIHFDLARYRKDYNIELYATLRYLMMDSRTEKLVLLIQSRAAFAEFLPDGNPLSEIGLRTVVLRGRS